MMGRRTFMKTCGLGMAAFALPQMLNSAGKTAQRPNIILLMADDLGWGDVGFNGNTIIRTPNLDTMSRESVTFTHFFSGGPVCSPTRGTCLTGRHYFRYGITDANTGHLPREEITMGDMCKSLGYRTGHFGKWHLGTLTQKEKDGRRGCPGSKDYSPPWENGFDECFSTEVQVPTWDPMRNQAFPVKYWTGPDQYAKDNLDGDDSRVIMDRAIPFIRKSSESGTPFLAVIWFHAPHQLVRAGPEYKAMYSNYSKGEQEYYGCISAMDEQIGRLRRELRELKIEKDTMVWFTSDNGPEGKNSDSGTNRGSTGGLRGRKRSLFCGGVMVPGILEWPGHVESGMKVNSPCSTLDYFPTTMDLTGYEWSGKQRPLDGISLLPLIAGKSESRPSPIAFRYIASRDAMFGSPTLCMIDNSYKFLTNFSDSGKEDMLFNISKDREEKENIIDDNPSIAGAMKAKLKEWIESCRTSHNGGDYDTPYTPYSNFQVSGGSWAENGAGGD